jgi:hypothetical protein
MSQSLAARISTCHNLTLECIAEWVNWGGKATPWSGAEV